MDDELICSVCGCACPLGDLCECDVNVSCLECDAACPGA